MRRLFIGGPAHGETHEVDPRERRVKFARYPEVRWDADPAEMIEPIRGAYLLCEIPDPITGSARGVMMDEGMDAHAALALLGDHLLRAWVNTDPVGVRVVFVGGPWHGREVDIPPSEFWWRVPVRTGGTVMYVRRRVADPATRTSRPFMALAGRDGRMALDRLADYLRCAWINAEPDR